MNFLSNYYDMVYDLYDSLRNAGHIVKILTINDSKQSSKKEVYSLESLKIIPKKLKHSYSNEILLLNNIIMLNGFDALNFADEKCDIIHCFDIESAICAKLLKDRFNAKLIYNFNDSIMEEKPGYQRQSKEKFKRYLNSWFLQFVDINFVHTEYNFNRLQNIYLIEETKIKMMPYFHKEINNGILHMQANLFTFLLLTTFNFEAEILTSLRFISLISKKIDAHLDLITNPDISIFGKLLSKTIRSLNVASNINWTTGFNLKLRELLQKNKPTLIFPFPKHHFDSLLFEAISMNLIIIYQPSIQNDELLRNYLPAYPLDFYKLNEEDITQIILFINNLCDLKANDRGTINEHINTNISIYEKNYHDLY
jgi:hypothetical protein